MNLVSEVGALKETVGKTIKNVIYDEAEWWLVKIEFTDGKILVISSEDEVEPLCSYFDQ